MSDPRDTVVVRELGRRDYTPVFEAMQAFTAARDDHTPDELWRVEHPPVFTLGLNGKREHLLSPGEIPVVPVDRGGQVTYHGPGQPVIYCLIDLKRADLGVRPLVTLLEQSVVELLSRYHIESYARPDAPGVYVAGRKIAALGLRVRRGRSYHGLALNVAMDLAPFTRINPCGYPGMAVTQMRDLGIAADPATVHRQLSDILIRHLGYGRVLTADTLPLSAISQEQAHVTAENP